MTNNQLREDMMAVIKMMETDPIVLNTKVEKLVTIDNVQYAVRIDTILGLFGNIDITYIDGKKLRANFDVEKLPAYLAAINACNLEDRLQVVNCAVDCVGRPVPNYLALVDSGHDDLSHFWEVYRSLCG